jgi:UDP-N-acetylmuramate dehydrogenase
MLVERDFDLTHYNSYRVKAACAIAYFPQTEEDLIEIYRDKAPKVILGGGYNVILSKPYYDTSFVIFDEKFSKVSILGNTITAQAGVNMLRLSDLALKNSLVGLEIFYDIPSSLGGAIVMNAGASGEEIKDLLVKVRYFDPTKLTFHEKHTAEIGFEYRNSFFQNNPHLIIVEATLQLPTGNKEAINDKMQRIKSERWLKQPREYPNGGSVFKRPKGFYVGTIMDQLNLKGYTVGGAKISEKHGGFIINFENAKGDDIVNLINFIQTKVFEKLNIMLEVEQRII